MPGDLFGLLLQTRAQLGRAIESVERNSTEWHELVEARDELDRLSLQLQRMTVRLSIAGIREAQAQLAVVNERLGHANQAIEKVHRTVELAAEAVALVRRLLPA